MSDKKVYGSIAAGCVVLLGLIIWGVSAAVDEENRWRDWCAGQSGHVVDHTETTTSYVVGANGKPGVAVGTSTTLYCLSADGRILGIR